MHAFDQLVIACKRNDWPNHSETGEIINHQTNTNAMFTCKLARQAPCDTDVAVVIDYPTENVAGWTLTIQSSPSDMIA